MKLDKFILIHLSMSYAGPNRSMAVDFDREVWNNIVERCIERGYKGILLDVLDGIKYESHPCIADPDGWTVEEMRKEVKRLKERGLTLYPKVNFSAAHDWWIKEYRDKLSTPEYYQFCKDIIEELYDVFDYPEYIHLGLDEEFPDVATTNTHYRKKPQVFEDYRYLIDCVRNLGAKCLSWTSTCMHNLEVWEQYFPKDIVFICGQYYEFEESKWTRIADQPKYVQDYYWGGGFEKRDLYKKYLERYGNTKIEFVEQDETIRMAADFFNYIGEKGYKFFY